MKNLFKQKETPTNRNPIINNYHQNESLLNHSMLNLSLINEFPESNLKKSVDFLPFFETKKNASLHFVAQNKISLLLLIAYFNILLTMCISQERTRLLFSGELFLQSKHIKKEAKDTKK